ncbi:DUF1365 domain-containing protein [Gayadomonas joobiniege]|uniref:DUF1365 domain-containing protein n=1 Tax=Gayadomonas joobiniege TaxID=1234606 RepID=UPI00035FC6A8|nr:DUF1365 domain-containing protein [Gayadomonas joobiniege]
MSQSNFNSAIYYGKTWHRRWSPKPHQFFYKFFMLWLDLDEFELLNRQLFGFSSKGISWGRFKLTDHFNDEKDVKKAVMAKTKSLGGELQGDEKIYYLGHLRYLGCYFSPLNLYYIFSRNGELAYLLAEVSNTPWNEKHFYLLKNTNGRFAHTKTFQVSPFNHQKTMYQWQFNSPCEHLSIEVANYAQHKKYFAAGMQLTKKPLNQKNYLSLLIRFPVMSVSILCAIYWQACKTWVKGNPFYGYHKAYKKSEK